MSITWSKILLLLQLPTRKTQIRLNLSWKPACSRLEQWVLDQHCRDGWHVLGRSLGSGPEHNGSRSERACSSKPTPADSPKITSHSKTKEKTNRDRTRRHTNTSAQKHGDAQTHRHRDTNTCGIRNGSGPGVQNAVVIATFADPLAHSV